MHQTKKRRMIRLQLLRKKPHSKKLKEFKLVKNMIQNKI